MAEATIRSFVCLTREERTKALRAITEDLSPYEWRDLKNLLNIRSFEHDIIGSPRLPLELVLHIFSFLDLAHVFRCQSVSKSWRGKLNTAATIGSILARDHYDKSPPLLYEEASNSAANELLVSRKKAERLLALQLGRPKLTFAIFPSIKDSADTLVKLYRHILVWVLDLNGLFQGINLHTGEKWTFATPQRTKSKILLLTLDYLLVTTETRTLDDIYMFSLKSGPPIPKPVRLPSPPLVSAADGNIAVFVLGHYLDHIREVVLLDMNTHRSWSISISNCCIFCQNHGKEIKEHGLVGATVSTASGGIVTIFDLCYEARGCAYLGLRQFDFQGSVISSQNFEIRGTREAMPNPATFKIRLFWDHNANAMCQLVPLNNCGDIRIILRPAHERVSSGVCIFFDLSIAQPLSVASVREVWVMNDMLKRVPRYQLRYRGMVDFKVRQDSNSIQCQSYEDLPSELLSSPHLPFPREFDDHRNLALGSISKHAEYYYGLKIVFEKARIALPVCTVRDWAKPDTASPLYTPIFTPAVDYKWLSPTHLNRDREDDEGLAHKSSGFIACGMALNDQFSVAVLRTRQKRTAFVISAFDPDYQLPSGIP